MIDKCEGNPLFFRKVLDHVKGVADLLADDQLAPLSKNVLRIVQHETGRAIDEARLVASLAAVTRAIEAVVPAADAVDACSSPLLPPLSQSEEELPAAAERVRKEAGESVHGFRDAWYVSWVLTSVVRYIRLGAQSERWRSWP